MSQNKLAVLMPVFNGGAQLLKSVFSCARAGLDGSQYELIVVDNCSTDGSTDHLLLRDASGAVVQVHRNASNIGRVGNWNRSIEIALGQGFEYITFLFAGDSWLSGGSLPALLRLVQENDAAIGLSPFVIADEGDEPKRSSQRFYVSGGSSVVTGTRQFLRTLLENGLFPLGPLQANIYRLSPNYSLHFDQALPTRTDVSATLRFLHGSEHPVVIVDQPFLQWREHSGRFHASMGPAQTVRDYLDTFHEACERTRIPVHYGRAKTRTLMNSVRLIMTDAHITQWMPLFRELFRHSGDSPYKSNFLYVLEALWLRLALRRRLLEFS